MEHRNDDITHDHEDPSPAGQAPPNRARLAGMPIEPPFQPGPTRPRTAPPSAAVLLVLATAGLLGACSGGSTTAAAPATTAVPTASVSTDASGRPLAYDASGAPTAAGRRATACLVQLVVKERTTLTEEGALPDTGATTGTEVTLQDLLDRYAAAVVQVTDSSAATEALTCLDLVAEDAGLPAPSATAG